MKDFTVVMALVDYVPVILFAVAAVMLQRDLYSKMSKGAFALFSAGTIDAFCAGVLKATYKLLYATGVCDFQPLSAMFFPLQTIGMLLAGIGVVAMLCHRQNTSSAMLIAPTVYQGTMLFVVLMILGLSGMNIGLGYISAKMKKPFAVIMFILSLVFSLTMGYLSSRDFSGAFMNWVAQGVNIIGQGSFLVGACVLHKAGLSSYEMAERNKND